MAVDYDEVKVGDLIETYGDNGIMVVWKVCEKDVLLLEGVGGTNPDAIGAQCFSLKGELFHCNYHTKNDSE